jgi:hypothetical protein
LFSRKCRPASRRRAVRPRLEELETRLAPAVTPTLLNGQLLITGDDLPSDITLDHAGTTTLVNGQAFADDDITAGIVINLGSSSDTVNLLATVKPVTLDGGGGVDTVNIGNAGDLQGIQAALTLASTGGLIPELPLDGSADAVARNVTLNASGGFNTVTGLAPAPIQFRASDVLLATIRGGSGGNTFAVQGLAAGAVVELHTGSGDDHITVSSAGRTLDDLDAVLNLDAGGGTNFLIVDQGHATVGDTITFTDNAVVSTGVGFALSYEATGGTFAGIALITGLGQDTVDVESTRAGALTGIVTGAGDDIIRVSSAAGTLDTLRGTLNIDAGAGSNALQVSAASSTTADAVGVTASSLFSTILGFTINYFATGGTYGGISLTTGSGDDLVVVVSAPAFTPLSIHTGAGSDTIGVVVTSSSALRLVLDGGTGDNTLHVTDLANSALVFNTVSGARAGVLRLLYPFGLESAFAYQGIGQRNANRPIF